MTERSDVKLSVLSPILFSIFENDLTGEIKDPKIGIDIDGYNHSILLFTMTLH